MYTRGDKPDTLFVGYSGENLEFNKDKAQSCVYEPSETSNKFLISLIQNTIYISKTNPRNSDYEICAKIQIKNSWMKSFYLTMLSRSSPTSSFRTDVKSLILSTDVENLGISEFEAKYDDNDHKLFRQIHFFQINHNETSHLFKDDSPEIDVKSLDLKTIHDYQSKIFNTFDYCNILLEKNIESTDDIITFLDQQKEAVDVYSKNMLTSMRTWIDETKAQFELMEKDTINIVTEFKAFDLESEFQITQNLLDILKGKFVGNAEKLQSLRLYGGQIKQNLLYIQSKKNELKNLPMQIKSYIETIEESYNVSADTFLLMLLIGAGFFVLVALVSIFCRLNKSQQIVSLGGI